MIEIRKINVKLVDTNAKVVENLSLRIENGRMEVIEGSDSITMDKLSEIVGNQDLYEIKIDDILFNHKSFKKLLSNKNIGKKLLNIVQNEFNLMYQNRFHLLNSFQKQKKSFLEYVNNQIGDSDLDVMEDIKSSLHTKLYGNHQSVSHFDPSIGIDQEKSEFDINHFVISGKLLNNSGFSLIQFLGLIIGLGLIILTSIKVYGAAVSANNVSYSNSSSGLSATNVQSAIDETYKKVSESSITYPRFDVGRDLSSIDSTSCQYDYHEWCVADPSKCSWINSNSSSNYSSCICGNTFSNINQSISGVIWSIDGEEMGAIDLTNARISNGCLFIDFEFDCSNYNFRQATGNITIYLPAGVINTYGSRSIYNQATNLDTGIYKNWTTAN